MLKILPASLSALGFALLLVQPLHAQENGAPQHWDLRNKVPKPELQGITRLRFVTTTDFPPFNFIDATGRLSGYHLDLARGLCAVLARQDACQIEAKPWEELAETLEKGEAEAILAGLTPTAETRKEYLFTKPFFTLPARFVSRSQAGFDPMAQGRKKVGVLAETVHHQLLVQQFDQLEAVVFDDQGTLFQALRDEKVDAVFGDGMRLSFWLGSAESQACCSFAGGAFLAPDYLGQGLSVAVSKKQPQLQAALDYALSELARNGTLDELYGRYFPIGFF
ncbi:transporter substrate-binding domain-containing protein [Limoniibacter endophyticus]|uniref:Amino acid ABC transporter n=1 Tax=Limoniibacter endophyticus TaxID=1565040 RepID=A0A8J3DQD9_9HYPH|nr:transporter substrate-binding domain-containing protein [Limoniibacter endophyticus]GHC66467.1 amino acid ABC transporter [Limoniibacter endophyticus]